MSGITGSQDRTSTVNQILDFSPFQLVFNDWCNKGCCMYYPVYGTVYINHPLLLIKNSPCHSNSRFPFRLNMIGSYDANKMINKICWMSQKKTLLSFLTNGLYPKQSESESIYIFLIQIQELSSESWLLIVAVLREWIRHGLTDLFLYHFIQLSDAIFKLLYFYIPAVKLVLKFMDLKEKNQHPLVMAFSSVIYYTYQTWISTAENVTC